MGMVGHPAFEAQPDSGQFAKNGSWEDAWAFEQNALPSRALVTDYLAGATEVAFEAFFGAAFFGARMSGEAQEVAEFSFACVSALGAATDGASFFSSLSKYKSLGAFGRQIVFSEIGAVNAWRSVGSVKTGEPRDALEKFDALWSSLASAPLARNTGHSKAIEFAGAFPIYHWFALPVSSSQPPFALDRELLRQALHFAATAMRDTTA